MLRLKMMSMKVISCQRVRGSFPTSGKLCIIFAALLQHIFRHMLHDPDVYSDPLTFNPDRFNGDDVKMERVKDFVFGFGRRFCPGRYFSGGSFFSIAATALATCNILPGFDKDGNKVFPKIAYTNGTIM